MATNATAVAPDFYSQLIGFGFNLWATLIGALVGFLFAIRYDRSKQRKEDIALKVRTLNAIKKELDFNLQGAKSTNTLSATSSIQAIFASGAYQSAIASGTLTTLRLDLQVALTAVYMRYKWAERYSDKIMSMTGSQVAIPQLLTDFNRELRTQCDSLAVTDIPKATKLVNAELDSLAALG